MVHGRWDHIVFGEPLRVEPEWYTLVWNDHADRWYPFDNFLAATGYRCAPEPVRENGSKRKSAVRGNELPMALVAAFSDLM
jgi:hypothetical protein